MSAAFLNTLKRFYRPVIAIILALLISGYFARNLLFGTPVEAQPVIKSELRQTVVASGRITWPQRVSVAAEITGRVNKVPVKEGQQVKRGNC